MEECKGVGRRDHRGCILESDVYQYLEQDHISVDVPMEVAKPHLARTPVGSLYAQACPDGKRSSSAVQQHNTEGYELILPLEAPRDTGFSQMYAGCLTEYGQ